MKISQKPIGKDFIQICVFEIQCVFEIFLTHNLKKIFTKELTPIREFLDIQATIECEFTLKRVRGMITTYSRII